MLDSETADAIATETIRYGQRVTLIAFACDPVWRTERGIAVAGPRAFGYDLDYQPVEKLAEAADLTAAPGSTRAAPGKARRELVGGAWSRLCGAHTSVTITVQSAHSPQPPGWEYIVEQ